MFVSAIFGGTTTFHGAVWNVSFQVGSTRFGGGGTEMEFLFLFLVDGDDDVRDFEVEAEMVLSA